RRHTRSYGDWSSDVCSSDLSDGGLLESPGEEEEHARGVQAEMARVLESDDDDGECGHRKSRRADVWTGVDGPASNRSGTEPDEQDRKSTRLNSSHRTISYAV